MSIPTIGRKVTPLRWVAIVVVRCECEGHDVLMLTDIAVTCPSCGMRHQLASFDLRGEPVLPVELGLRVASFLPAPVKEA